MTPIVVWSIRVDVEPDVGDDESEDLLEALLPYSPAIGIDGAQLAVEAPTADAAIRVALKATRAALLAAGMVRHRIVGLVAMTWEQFEYELEQPDLPQLLGLAEIGKMLGVSRQRVGQLAQTPTFPAPAAKLATGPVWTLPAVERWSANWPRKSGRPARDRTSA